MGSSVFIPSGIVISTVNSTTVPLAELASFVGEWEDVTAYQELTITGGDLPTGEPGTLLLEFSRDGITAVDSTRLNLDVGGPAFSPQFARITLPFMRVTFTNGAVAQATFILTTVYHVSSAAKPARRLSATIAHDEPTEVVRAVIAGQRPDGLYASVPITVENYLRVQIADITVTPEDNATSTLLGPGEVFTGSWDTTRSSVCVLAQLITDKESAAGGFVLQFSDNAIDVLASVATTIPAGGGTRTASHSVRGKYFRFVYTNGPFTQGVFRLSALGQATASGLTTQLISTSFTEGNIAPLVRSCIAAKDETSGIFSNIMGKLAGGVFALYTDITDRASRLLGVVSVSSSALPTGAATLAAQTQPGVDIGDVTINNTAGASAVNIQDGGNSITVDGIFFQATQPVSASALPLPSGASTEATLALIKSKTDNLDVALSTRAVTGLTDSQLRASAVPVSGTITANPSSPATATITRVSVGGTSVMLLSSNVSRKGAVIFNEAGILFVKFGTTSSSSSYTYRLTTNQTLEIPYPVYTGRIDAIKSSGTSNVLVTELT
jgi:hypothetical protein